MEDHYAYVVGYLDGLVHPEKNITRAEVSTIFFRMLLDESREYCWAQENSFTDVPADKWFNNAVSTLANAQLITDYPDGTFRPNQLITRAEALTIVDRVMKRAPHKDHLLEDIIQWPDNLNKNAWYYADVQEATNSHKFHMDKEEAHEIWTELLPVRDWAALEREWSEANSSRNPGEVVDININTPEANP